MQPNDPSSFPHDPDIPDMIPMTMPQKRSKMPLFIALAVVLLALVAAGVYYYVAVLNKKPAVSVTSSTVKQAPVADAKSIVTDLKKVVSGTPLVVAKREATSGFTSQNDVVYTTMYQTTGDRKFWTNPTESFGFGTQGTENVIRQDYAAMVTYLKSHQFEKKALPELAASFTDPKIQLTREVYVSDDVVCNLELDDYSDPKLGTHYHAFSTGAGCADLASYETVAKSVDPFYEAYAVSSDAKLHPDFLKNMYTTLAPVVKDGVSGYKNADVGFGEGLYYYYQEPSKSWTFLYAGQNGLDCNKVNATVSLKKAFAGQKCTDYTTMKDSVVSAT
jgi:hypothetical protein